MRTIYTLWYLYHNEKIGKVEWRVMARTTNYNDIRGYLADTPDTIIVDVAEKVEAFK